ncbi:hypothetical protein [Flavobacterium sp. JP2137]|uniref:hypothetical protein n=1 Tax=Flavobacterium sp. JP2137 TaxID=3414510 RepID=UPI003D2FD062
MKKIVVVACLFSLLTGYAQERPQPTKTPKDTVYQAEEPVKITPQQMDIEPAKKGKVPQGEPKGKAVPTERPKKEETQRKSASKR